MRSLGLALFLSIGAAGTGFAQLAPAGTGGVAALVTVRSAAKVTPAPQPSMLHPCQDPCLSEVA